MKRGDAVVPVWPSEVPVDLDNCAVEPIHIPGSVQPRGVLLSVREVDLMVVQVSDNVLSMVGVEVADAVGHPLSDVLGRGPASAVERVVRLFGSLEERNPLDAVIEVDGRPVAMDVILHRAAEGVDYVESDFLLPRGAAMILYSDGLVERRTETLDTSLDRLASVLAALGPHTDAAEIFAATKQPGATDDATVVVVNRLARTNVGQSPV